MGTIPGVTTLTQLGVAAVVTSAILLAHEFSRRELWKLLTVIGLALPRAYIFSERLAILELVVPVFVILAAHFSTRGGLREKFVKVLPLVSVPAVVIIFGFFEYFRSWTFYRTHGTASYTEFILSRLAGYYATAINNGHLILTHMDWPNRLPYDTVEAFWTAPGIESSDLYQSVAGHASPYTRGYTDSLYFDVLTHFGNPEFNNQSGYVAPFIDYGTLIGLVFFLMVGVVAGILYRSFCVGGVLGLFLYPVVFVGLLELPRLMYWSLGRSTYSLFGLLVVVALLSRTAGKDKDEL